MLTVVVPMSTTDVFFDSNVILYSISGNPVKEPRSLALIAAGGTISVQVLNETAFVMRRKLKLEWPVVERALLDWKTILRVVPIALQTHERAVEYAKRFQDTIYDSMIVAAAVLSGCTTLYSEDMSDGQVIDGVTIHNPYRP